MLSIIVAVSENYAIGKDGSLLWHFPKDLKRFKDITMDSTIIMGRKTFNSIPRILPGRHHIVLTRDKDFIVNDDRVTIVNSLDDLFKLLDCEKENFVIGGGEIYKLLLPYCHKIYLTQVHKSFEADAFFPTLDFSQWEIKEEETGYIEDNKLTSYSFITLTKEHV